MANMEKDPAPTSHSPNLEIQYYDFFSPIAKLSKFDGVKNTNGKRFERPPYEWKQCTSVQDMYAMVHFLFKYRIYEHFASILSWRHCLFVHALVYCEQY